MFSEEICIAAVLRVFHLKTNQAPLAPRRKEQRAKETTKGCQLVPGAPSESAHFLYGSLSGLV